MNDHEVDEIIGGLLRSGVTLAAFALERDPAYVVIAVARAPPPNRERKRPVRGLRLQGRFTNPADRHDREILRARRNEEMP